MTEKPKRNPRTIAKSENKQKPKGETPVSKETGAPTKQDAVSGSYQEK